MSPLPSIRRKLRRVFAHLSIRNKLIVVVAGATVISLGAGFLVVLLNSLQQFEEDLIHSTDVIARSVGTFSSVALAFEDEEGAEEALAPVQAFEQISDVYLYDVEGNLFAHWTRSGTLNLPDRRHDVHSEVAEGHVQVFRPIIFDKKRYGTIFVRASTASLEDRTRQFLVFMALLMLALVGFSVFVAAGLQGLISRPILELADHARHVSEHADYSLRVENPGSDEIGVLYDGFNAMLEQVQSRQEELERSNRDLDQFAYVASHDLKAPLRAIATLSTWLEEDLSDEVDDEAKEQLRLMRSRVQRMDALIEGILQYSRAGRLTTGTEPVDVGHMVRELVAVLDLPEGMEIEIADDMPLLETRRLRLEQVFQNLISNAIKYHDDPGNGRVEVGWSRDDDGTPRFWVEDDGPGIAAEHHDRVFLMFQTLQPRDRVESTGLGLSLVTKLVEEEGGKVSLRSAKGEGARFEFTWPVDRRPGASRPSASQPSASVQSASVRSASVRSAPKAVAKE